MTIAMTTQLKKKEAAEAGGTPSKAEAQKAREREEKAEAKHEKEEADAEARKNAGPVMSAYYKTMDVVNSQSFQLALYLVFVLLFQLLAGVVRQPQEYYLDKHVMDRIVENHFDSSHNTFESVRRIADIYEWGNNVLIPGLFADMGPCDSTQHTEQGVRTVKTCNDDAWPDGIGSFHVEGATPFGLTELVRERERRGSSSCGHLVA